MANSVKAYVQEAIEIERAGVKVKETTDFECPEELIGIFAGDPDFKASFDKLTPGRQRGCVLYFVGAKQSKTRAARIQKYRRKILDAKGLHDR